MQYCSYWKGITFTCVADGDALNFMSDIDICSLFGNTYIAYQKRRNHYHHRRKQVLQRNRNKFSAVIMPELLPIGFWIPCMILAVMMMCGFIWLTVKRNVKVACYLGVQAFIVAEFAASAEWWLYYFFAFLI